MKISLTRLSTKELATLSERVINASNNGKYKVLKQQTLLIKLEEQYALYEQVYSKLSYSGKGKSVAKADDLRDNLFKGLKQIVAGYTVMSSMPNYEVAKELYAIIKQYGLGINRLSYSEETAQMNKLLMDFHKPINKPKLEALHLYEVLQALQKAQEDFEILFAQQAEANADLHSLPSATVIRKDLQKALRSYLMLIKIMKTEEGWQMVYADINEMVKAAARSYTNTKPDNELYDDELDN